ncbi:MAG: hypothetical protein H8E18_14955 [FCB group bacterium]|nr:hypothetical protein [FCB group bacterium]
MIIDWSAYTKEEEESFDALPLLEKQAIIEKNWKNESATELIQAQLSAMQQSFPAPVPANKLAIHTRIPHTALSLREVLYARMLDLSKNAFELLKENKSIAGIILSRSALETVALIVVFELRVKAFLDSEDEENLDTFLKGTLLGSKDKSTTLEAVNILTHIDKVDKKHSGFRQMFDELCEMAHPNWAGV